MVNGEPWEFFKIILCNGAKCVDIEVKGQNPIWEVTWNMKVTQHSYTNQL